MIKGVSQEQIDFILSKIRFYFPQSRILVFGSRLYGQPRTYSDLDICIDNKKVLPLAKLYLLEEAFEESDIPFKIDISDFNRISDEFKKLVETKGQTI